MRRPGFHLNTGDQTELKDEGVRPSSKKSAFLDENETLKAEEVGLAKGRGCLFVEVCSC
jgi:hypothetical protein